MPTNDLSSKLLQVQNRGRWEKPFQRKKYWAGVGQDKGKMNMRKK